MIATVPKKYGAEPVARFSMSLSVKLKGAPARDAAPDDRAGAVLH